MTTAAQHARQDMHVHSTFSDGTSTIAENVAEAERLGLLEMTCVDHVRRDTDWVPRYVAAVREMRARTSVVLHCAVEAKLLDTFGNLDIPDDLDGVDAIYAADHQVPMPDGPHNPREIRAAIETGGLRARTVIESIIISTAMALRRHERIVIAHLFSVLPKLGLTEADVPEELIELLAATAAETGARIEVDERWSCPSAATLAPFVRRGVTLLMSTDSHRLDTIGRYDYCDGVVRELTATPLAVT